MAIEKKEVECVTRGNECWFSHPAFGQITASRVSSSEGMSLYGSEMLHTKFIEITISSSEMNRKLSKDWHHSRNEKVKITLSEGQWGEFISSLNVGSGVPCTMNHIGDESMPLIVPFVKVGESFLGEAESIIDETKSNLNDAISLLENSGLSKKKLDEIKAKLNKANQNLSSSHNFVLNQFQKKMEDMVHKAKTEVNGHAQSVLKNSKPLLGIEEFGDATSVDKINSVSEGYIKAVDSVSAGIEVMSSSYVAGRLGHNKRDSVTTLMNVTVDNNGYELQVIGIGYAEGNHNYFEWVNESGEAVGEVFNNLKVSALDTFNDFCHSIKNK